METKKPLTPAQLSVLGASKGGRARASILTPDQRSAIAREAVRTRWLKAGKLKAVAPEEKREPKKPSPTPSLPFSMFRGKVQLGDLELECHVLNDGQRVFTQGEMVRAITGGADTSNLRRYISRIPSLDTDLSAGPIRFQIPGIPTIAIGSEATRLIEICERYLQAADQELLRPNQMRLARNAAIIVRACAKLGIIALIDEATGYQKVRARNALPHARFGPFPEIPCIHGTPPASTCMSKDVKP